MAKFLFCEHCGNIVEIVKDAGGPVMCCGEKMQELVPGAKDAAVEKHVPVIKAEGDNVKVVVGEVSHPMQAEHYIEWIMIETDKGVSKKILKPGEAPEADFVLSKGEKLVSAYAYCNLHGLWKAEAAL